MIVAQLMVNNSFVTIMDKYQETGNGILKGIPYALKDNISTKGILTTASSNILSNYVSRSVNGK